MFSIQLFIFNSFKKKMASYPKQNERINLANYKQIKKLANGKTNDVSLWEHKQDSNIKIVVKKPCNKNPDLVQHNLKAINAFFGSASAWRIEGEQAFAMKYYAGKPLLEQEANQFVKKKNSPTGTIAKMDSYLQCSIPMKVILSK